MARPSGADKPRSEIKSFKKLNNGFINIHTPQEHKININQPQSDLLHIEIAMSLQID